MGDKEWARVNQWWDEEIAVDLVSRRPRLAECRRCGLRWRVRLMEGELEPGWWNCPAGCNRVEAGEER